MSASSRKEFKKDRLDADDQKYEEKTPIMAFSSSSSSPQSTAPEISQQIMPSQLGLNNKSLFFSPPAAVSVLQSTFSNLRDQSVLSRICKAGQTRLQERVKQQTIVKLAAQHFLDGNIAEARALLATQTNNAIYSCTVEATHRRCYLALMSEDQDCRKPTKIYIETTSTQLNYQFLSLNGKTLINGQILWEKLPADFPQDIKKIMAAKDIYKDIYLARIVEQISTAGYTFHSGQKVRGTLLQIAAMAGATRANKDDDDMLKEWSAHLPPTEVTRQLQAVLLGEEERAARMQPHVTALEEFYKKISGAQKTTRAALEIELADAIETFKRAFIPDRNTVITKGHIFDLKIFVRAGEIFLADVVDPAYEEWFGAGAIVDDDDKHDFFDVYVIGTLQACAVAWDLQILKKGIQGVVENSVQPDRTLNFTSGLELSGLGVSIVLRQDGSNNDGIAYRTEMYTTYKRLIQEKNNNVVLFYATAKQLCQEQAANPLAFFGNPVTAIAAASESSIGFRPT